MTRTEVRCPGCGGGWTIEGPRGGEMLCPTCMTRIPLAATATVADDDPPSATPPARPAEPAVPPPRPAPAPPPKRAALLQARVADGPVVCPRCQLHFHPRSGAVEPQAAGRPTVLVVDDLAYFRQIAVDALEPKFAVRTAGTSADARAILAGGGIDLLVLDLTLDGCNAGHDLLSELSPKPCPILIFTAQDESEIYGEFWEDLQRLGADDLVIKGMKVAESLARKVSTLLGVAIEGRPQAG